MKRLVRQAVEEAEEVFLRAWFEAEIEKGIDTRERKL
jgi:hypothetical protein